MAFSDSLKSEVRRKSHHACCLCKSISVEIHHIIPQEEQGADTLDNAAPLCPSCHDIFGANPQKRKMIKEARDLWYEICENRYRSDADRIDDLLKELAVLRSNLSVPHISTQVANAVVERLVHEGVIQPVPSSGWPISKLLERIARFESELPVPDRESVDLTYELLFNASVDVKTQLDTEYDEEKNRFLKIFGSLIARNLCAYLVVQLNINWVSGVSKEKLHELMLRNHIEMTLLLMHKDISTEGTKLSIWIDSNNAIVYTKSSEQAQ
jgi:HNH endonuclease